MSDGIVLIAAERQRQIEQEGWTPEHDAEHGDAALAWAAACYAAPEPIYRIELDRGSGRGGSRDQIRLNAYEPWPALWRRPECDRIRELVKAGALITAEIDRLSTVASMVRELAELRSRASIGPDSERIRKLEVEVERLRQDHFIISVSGGSMLTCVCRCGELLSAVGTSNPDWLLSAHIKQARAS